MFLVQDSLLLPVLLDVYLSVCRACRLYESSKDLIDASLLTSLDRPAPASIGFVAALLAMDRTTLTANLKPLERQGLVTIGIDPADRRGRLLTLTKEGRKLQKAAVPIWKRTHTEIDGRLAQTDPGALRAGLRLLA